MVNKRVKFNCTKRRIPNPTNKKLCSYPFGYFFPLSSEDPASLLYSRRRQAAARAAVYRPRFNPY